MQQPDLDYRYIVGIDLGTTNSAVAYVDLTAEDGGDSRRSIEHFAIPQLIDQAQIGLRSVLPSFLYLPGEHELPAGSSALPWDPNRRSIVGEYARTQGARVPARLVSSAKSWLSHGGVDRTAPILPWGSDEEVDKVSPVAAATAYLRHLVEAWNEQMAGGQPHSEDHEEAAALAAQLVILTVPASFDEVARELTVEAARQAGIRRAILLEEPLAAFYAWLSANESTWEQQMADGQLVLVCDVGGGTSDFSILAVQEGQEGLRINRLAVGDHILLGGDNMDYTLGHMVETRLLGTPGKLDTRRRHQLVHQCRQAKEKLFVSDADEEVEITLMGSGSQLIGGTLKTALTRNEVEQIIVDGFFPAIAADDAGTTERRAGLTEFGLPFEQDPSITRHLLRFWQHSESVVASEVDRKVPIPDFVLFNGGTLASRSIRRRVLGSVRKWFAAQAETDWSPTELANSKPEAAVALGAAYYGLVRLGMGVRVGSGSPRAYYVAVDSAATEKEAEAGGRRAVCLIPRGTEEGYEMQLKAPGFEALANQPVAFQVLASSTRLGDRLGDIVQLGVEEVNRLPPIRTVLRFGKRDIATSLPVQLGVRLTEIGTLDLGCYSQTSDHRWQLQFDVRRGGEPDSESIPLQETVDDALVEALNEKVTRTFVEGLDAPETLRKRLESTVGMLKEAWPTALIRRLADTLIDAAAGRKRTAEHEARWLNLLGFCMRPGFGDPVDEWRMKRLWKFYFEGLAYPRQAQNRTEWWIMWRRLAGGMKAGQQIELYQQVRPYLYADTRRRKKASPMFPKSISSGEALEIWMALANFEWLPADVKRELGNRMLDNLADQRLSGRNLWALSRFGARRTIYGPLDRLVDGKQAAFWVNKVLAMQPPINDATAHALVLMARSGGDREMDVDDKSRASVESWLQQLHESASHIKRLRDPGAPLRGSDREQIFGEALPSGLVLTAPETE